MSMTGNFNGPGPYVVEIAQVSGAGITPTGNDDSARLTQYVSDMAASGLPAVLGAGDFIIGTPMAWRSAKVMSKWSSKGIGLTVRGQGPGDTRLLWSAALSDANNMLTINAPTAAGIGARNYLTQLSNMSFIRAPGGTEIAAGSTDGYGLYCGPAQAGDVIHTPKFSHLFFDGFAYATTLSDCTLPEFDTCWWNEFLVGVRLGYNLDLTKIRHCMFGSEQFGASHRNSAIGITINEFSDGFNPVGSANVVEVEQTWFMKLGLAIRAGDTSLAGLHVHHNYFEECKRYFYHQGTGSYDSFTTWEKNHFSHQNTNDTTQHDPTLANYEAKIQFDGDVTVSGGKRPVLSFRNNTADSAQTGNAWISFNERGGYIEWQNNNLRPSTSFGHIRCTRNGYQTWRSIQPDASSKGGMYVFGDSNQAGLGKLAGQPLEVSATIGSGATYDLDPLSGEVFYLTLPDGDCTINTYNYSATPPSRCYSPLTKFKVVLIVPASVTATRTITWGSRLKMNAGTLTYAAADQNKRAVVMLEGYSNSGSGMQLTSPAPTFVA